MKKKKMVDYGKNKKKMKFLNRFIALELSFTMEKLWYYGKNYGAMEKTMVLWKTLWYYTESYGNLIYDEKIWDYGKTIVICNKM